MAQWLCVSAALPKDPSSVPNKYIGSQPPGTLVQRDLLMPPGLRGHRTHVHIPPPYIILKVKSLKVNKQNECAGDSML